MRILLVNHTFPPASYAGSEICVYNTARELQSRGCQAAVFYRVHDPNADEYSIESSEYEGVPVFAINHTYQCARSFQDIYVNSAIAARFGRLLREWKPDLVHFHHLTNLSLSLVDEVKEYGAAAVMTLHDYWLLCQRGQLLKRNLSLCAGPSLDGCRSCLAPQLLRGNAQRLVSSMMKRVLARGSKNDGSVDLLDLRNAKIQTPDRRFVERTCFEMGDGPGDTLQAHPPTELIYPLSCELPATFETSVGLHPSMYEREGSGVCFEIERNGEILFSRSLNPKKNADHRGWHAIRLDFHPVDSARDVLTLRTRSELEDDNRFCTAGWRTPIIRPHQKAAVVAPSFCERKREIRDLLYQAAELVTDGVCAFSQRAEDGMHHRMNWVRRVWDRMDGFISPSRFLRDFFDRNGFSAMKIEYLDNGFVAAPEEIDRPVDRPIRFGYIGTWIPSKGVDLAIQAFRDIDPGAARLIVHGFFPGYDGYEDYELYLKSLAGPAVEWKGKYEPHEIYTLLAELDCMIVPSIWWENSPLTVHEAFQARVPIVAADVGGMAELVRDGGGLTFRHRDAESLECVVRRIIGNPGVLDGLRRSVPCVQSITEHVERLLKIYTRVTGKKPSQ